MGKLSNVFILLLAVNIVGFILMQSMVEEAMATGNPYVSDNTLLVKFYTPMNTTSGQTIYTLTNTSPIVESVPTETPTSLIQEGISFVDRIFIIFGFIRLILGTLLFPIALISFMGLPWQLSMLFFAPLTMLYIFGLIDLVSGGDN